MILSPSMTYGGVVFIRHGGLSVTLRGGVVLPRNAGSIYSDTGRFGIIKPVFCIERPIF